ncbi:MAG TPA: ABC transporter permease [Gemmatimonadaceae bacterium]
MVLARTTGASRRSLRSHLSAGVAPVTRTRGDLVVPAGWVQNTERRHRRQAFRVHGGVRGWYKTLKNGIDAKLSAVSGTSVWPASADVTDPRASRSTTLTTVSAGWFEMLGIPVVRGRPFAERDQANAPRVVVVNESFARMMWPDAEAVGQTIRFAESRSATVIGVARDIKYKSLSDENVPFLYRPLAQAYSGDMVLQVRVREDTPAIRDAIRTTVQALDRGLPLTMVRSMQDDMAISLLPARAGTGFLTGFGALALLLATIGIYGVTAFVVGQRAREIGVRTALGATGSNVLRLMMRETLVLVIAGLVLGLVGSIGVGAVLSSWLYGVGALDPRPLVGAGAVLLTVALLGTWVPARRALRVDPVVALRASEWRSGWVQNTEGHHRRQADSLLLTATSLSLLATGSLLTGRPLRLVVDGVQTEKTLRG